MKITAAQARQIEALRAVGTVTYTTFMETKRDYRKRGATITKGTYSKADHKGFNVKSLRKLAEMGLLTTENTETFTGGYVRFEESPVGSTWTWTESFKLAAA